MVATELTVRFPSSDLGGWDDTVSQPPGYTYDAVSYDTVEVLYQAYSRDKDGQISQDTRQHPRIRAQVTSDRVRVVCHVARPDEPVRVDAMAGRMDP